MVNRRADFIYSLFTRKEMNGEHGSGSGIEDGEKHG
jgi:hypothetical protein